MAEAEELLAIEEFYSVLDDESPNRASKPVADFAVRRLLTRLVDGLADLPALEGVARGLAALAALTDGSQRTQVDNWPETTRVAGTVALDPDQLRQLRPVAAPEVQRVAGNVNVAGRVTVTGITGDPTAHDKLDSILAALEGWPSTASPTVGTVTASGATTVVAAPAAPDFLRVWALHATTDPDSSSFPSILFRSATTATPLWQATAIQKAARWDLPAGEALEIVLSQAATGDGVSYTVVSEVVTP